MPPPGDTRPARLTVELHDLIWDAIYAPIAIGIGIVADRLNRPAIPDHPPVSQPGLRALVFLLLVLAIWP